MSQALAGKENAAASQNGAAAAALSSGELKAMLGQCLKLASENKITSQNTWSLPLIEHLDDLVRQEAPGEQTNFQRASVTLDAGVKIYSYRVDSVHTATFKILGGLGRAAGPGDAPDVLDAGADDADGEGGGGRRKRAAQHDTNPEATLESSLDALNVKKFDLAFAVDPLFHKTSAQFDEGGAKGLLLNTLGVYGGCNIVFDSNDVPEAALDGPAGRHVAAGAVELGGGAAAALEAARAALAGGAAAPRISPTLDSILELLGEVPEESVAAEAEALVAAVAGSAPAASAQLSGSAAGGGECESGEAISAGGAYDPAGGEYDGGFVDDACDDGDGGFDEYGGGLSDDDAAEAGERSAAGLLQQCQGTGALPPGSAHRAPPRSGLGGDGLSGEDLLWLLAAGSGASAITGAAGWAGGGHWRYRAGPAGAAADQGAESGRPAGKRGARKRSDPLDFEALLAAGGPGPQFPLLLAATRRARARPAANTLLPEDLHYQVETLARFALRPRSLVGGAAEGEAGPAGGDAGYDDLGCGDDGGGDDYGDYGDAYGSGAGADLLSDLGQGGAASWAAGGLGGEDGGMELVQASRKVGKLDVSYSRAAKQVDVRALKEIIWAGVRGAAAGADTVEFKAALARVPAANAAGRLEDLSVHLCFICLLHLCNEHGLAVRGVPSLDGLQVSNILRAA